MKKNVYYIALALTGATLLTQSCSSELEIGDTVSSVKESTSTTFTATQEGSEDDTRTTISGYSVNWSAGDGISVFDGDANHPFTLTSGDGTTSGTFSGTIENTATSFTALYPYTSNATLAADGTISGITLPTEQTAVSGSFDPKAAIMTAKSTTKDLAFKNVCSFAKVTTSEPSTEIIFKGGDADKIAGTFSVTLDGNGITTEATVTGTDNAIRLYPSKGNTTFAAGTYYIALLPQETLHGLTAICYGVSKTYTKSLTNDISNFKRKKIVDLGSTDSWNKKDVPDLLSGSFSVSDTKKVQFTRSNLYWNGSTKSFYFEDTQLEGSQVTTVGTYNPNYVSRFYWTNLTDYQTGEEKYMPYAETVSFEQDRLSKTDQFWCGEDNKLTVNTTSNLYTLTGGNAGEWNYLLEGRTNASSLYKSTVTVTNGATVAQNCLIIAPDDYDFATNPLKETYTLEEINKLGLVCLAAAGARQGNKINVGGLSCCYWSATPYKDDRWNAYYLKSSVDGISAHTASNQLRDQFCYSIRLVRTCE